jgi:hypothetical protein
MTTQTHGIKWFANQQDIEVYHWMPIPDCKGE